MVGQVTVKALKCERCGHIWFPRNQKTLLKNVKHCARCKSQGWNSSNSRYKVRKNRMSKRKVEVVKAVALVTLIGLALCLTGPTMAMAAKSASSSSSSGGGGGSDSGGGSKGSGGSDGGSKDSGGGHSGNGGSSGSDKSSSSIGKNGDNLANDDDHGPPSAPGNDLPGNDRTKNPTAKFGSPNCHQFGTCTPTFGHSPRSHDGSDDQICRGTICVPKIHDRFHDDHDHRGSDVRVVQKTVVVHDHNNNPQTIILNQNQQGTCFVTQTQIANSNDILSTLLEQCISITIVRG